MPAMTLANLVRRLNRTRPRGFPAGVMLTDAGRSTSPLADLRGLPPGSAVILRHYGEPGRRALAMRLAGEAHRRRHLVLVAADWRLAAAAGADGVHLPEAQARSGRLAPLLGWIRRRHRRLTVACHSRAALAAARRLGADLALLSPVFPTASHPGVATIGAVRFRLWARTAGLPVAALGGITGATAPLLGQAAAALAAIGGWRQKERAAEAALPAFDKASRIRTSG